MGTVEDGPEAQTLPAGRPTPGFAAAAGLIRIVVRDTSLAAG
jgi:hypothetical protein